jgi:hypothetical protein
MSEQKVFEETQMIAVKNSPNNGFTEQETTLKRKELKMKYLTTFIIYFCSFTYVSFQKRKIYAI